MTTSIKIHVNGRYRATVKQDDREPVVVEGNYEGSPNPSGEMGFLLPHPAKGTFEITEEAVPEPTSEGQEPATMPFEVLRAGGNGDEGESAEEAADRENDERRRSRSCTSTALD